jgi:hypothetical protein
MQEILWNWVGNLVTAAAFEPGLVAGGEIEMRTLQRTVLFVMVDYILNWFLSVKTSLVDCFFGEVGLDDLEFAEVSPALALLAQTVLVVVMGEIAVI